MLELAMGFILGVITMCIFIGGKDEWRFFCRYSNNAIRRL